MPVSLVRLCPFANFELFCQRACTSTILSANELDDQQLSSKSLSMSGADLANADSHLTFRCSSSVNVSM